jgi:cytochrome P450
MVGNERRPGHTLSPKLLAAEGSAAMPAKAPVVFDPREVAVMPNPFPFFRQLQEEDPVHWSQHLSGWILTRYEDVRRAAITTDMSADRLRPFFAQLSDAQRRRLADLIRYLTPWAVFRDPPDHTRIRSMMNKAFMPRAVEARLTPNIAGIIGDLLDRMERQAKPDLIRDFAYALPATVIMDLLGVPHGDLDLDVPDKYTRGQEGTRQMSDYFRRLIADRRTKPRDDLMTDLIAARDDAGGLDNDEVIAACILMLFAGYETTTNLIGNGMLALLRHSEALARLRADAGLAASAVEECLRYDGPIGALTRVVAVEHEVHGRTLRKGDRVFPLVNAANRDPRAFAEPDRFDVARRPNPHITFGFGPHFCLGAPLARLEGKLALGEIVRRYPGLSLAGDAVAWTDSLVAARSYRPSRASRRSGGVRHG